MLFLICSSSRHVLRVGTNQCVWGRCVEGEEMLEGSASHDEHGPQLSFKENAALQVRVPVTADSQTHWSREPLNSRWVPPLLVAVCPQLPRKEHVPSHNEQGSQLSAGQDRSHPIVGIAPDCRDSAYRHLCVNPSDPCADGLLNGDETDVDCGGSCGGCGLGEMCDDSEDWSAEAAACEGGFCTSCTTPGCYTAASSRGTVVQAMDRVGRLGTATVNGGGSGPSESLTISPPSVTGLTLGQTVQLEAAGGYNSNYDWAIGKPSAGSIDQVTGLYTHATSSATGVTVMVRGRNGRVGNATVNGGGSGIPSGTLTVTPGRRPTPTIR